MNDGISQAVVNVVPVLVGGAMTGVGGYLAGWCAHRRSRASLACAIAGEIQSILMIIDKREYLPILEQMIEDQSGAYEDNQGPPFCVTYNYFEVFQANAGKIGDLPDEIAKQVVSFYTIAKALLEDMNPANVVRPEYVLPKMRQQVDFLCQLIKLGKEAVQGLKRV